MPKIISRKPSVLKLHPDNPRIINDAAFLQLQSSIRNNTDYFEARPLILSNRTGELVVIAGNQRLRAAMEIGLTVVPTVLIEGLDERREREIMLRDNVSSGRWDIEGLRLNFSDLPLVDIGIELPPVEITEINPIGGLSGTNYGDAHSKTKVPVNILGIGGLVDRGLMEQVRDKLMDIGCIVDEDNGEALAEIYRQWL